MAFKKLTAGLMAASMILGMAANAAAEITTATPFDVATKMNKLGVVTGAGTNPDGSIDFNLGGNLTRAELVTTIVRSFGAEPSAQLAKGAPSFRDVAPDAWYSGYVAVAKNLAAQQNATIGRDSNTFDPNANISAIDALVFTMKFLGIKVESSGANWYEAWVNKAIELGILTKADAAIILANPTAAATRGQAFIILDFGYSAKVLEGGKSIYTTYVDPVAPTVEIAAPAESTTEAKITIAGKVSDNKAVASVTVNGTAVVVKDGSFSTDVELKLGANSIQVVATDLAGNTADKTFKVTRANAAAKSIEAADFTVAAGGTATVTASVKDANDQAIADAKVEATSTVGTFAAGTFTAGQKAGEGTLTLKYGELTKDVKVTVTAGELAKVEVPASLAPNKIGSLKATDAYGNAVAGAAFAVKGSDKAFVDAAGTFIASAAGSYTVVATAGGKSVEGTVGVYGAVSGFKVTAPAQIVANAATPYTFTATAIDANGNSVPSFNGDVTFAQPSGADLPGTAKDGVVEFKVTATDSLVGEELTFTASADVDGVTVKGSTKVNVVAQVATGVKVSTGGQKYLPSNSSVVTPETAAVTVTVVDQEGKPMLDGEWTADVAITGPGLFSDGKSTKSVVINNFTGPLTVQAAEPGATGAITINATSTGLTAGSATITAAVAQKAAAIQVTPGETTKIVASSDPLDSKFESVSYSVQVTDKYGVPVKTVKTLKVSLEGITQDQIDAASAPPSFPFLGAGLELATARTLKYVESGSDIVQYSTNGTTWNGVSEPSFSITTDADGKATVDITSWKAGTFSATVSDPALTGALTTAAKQSFEVSSTGVVAKISRVTAVQVRALRGKANTMTWQASDRYGNKVPKADVPVNFVAWDLGGMYATVASFPPGSADVTLDGKTSAAPFTKKTDANGQVAVEVVANGALQRVYLVIPAMGDLMAGPPSDYVVLLVDAAIPASVTTKVMRNTHETDNLGHDIYTEYAGALNVDDQIKIVATVKDQDGYVMNNLWYGDLKLTSSAKETVDSTNWNNVGNGVYETPDITVTKAGSQTYTVELPYLFSPIKVTTRSIAVRAGAPFKVTLAELNKDGELELDADKAKEVTLQILDKHDNVLSAGALPKWKAQFSSPTTDNGYISFRDASGNELITSGIEIPANRSSAKVFVVTNDISANTFTVKITIDSNRSGTVGDTINGDADQVITQTFTIHDPEDLGL